MLDGLKIGMFGLKSDLKGNSYLGKKLLEEQRNYTPIETSTTPKKDTIGAQNMMSFATGGYSGQFSDTSTLIDRQIEDLSKKNVMPKLNFQTGFGGFEGITKPLGVSIINPSGIGQQTQMTNRAPEVRSQIIEGIKQPVIATDTEQPTIGVKMNLAQFGDTIKAKYPDYEDMDSEDLGRKMLQKYPEYNDMVDVKTKFEDLSRYGKLLYTPENEEERKQMPWRWKLISIGGVTQEDYEKYGFTKEDIAVSAGFISKFPEMIANTISFAGDNPLTRALYGKEYTKGASERIKNKGQEIKKEIYKAMGTQEGIGGFNEQAAKFVAEMIPLALIPEARIGELGAGFISKFPKLGNLLFKTEKGVITLTAAGKSVKYGLAGLLGMEAYSMVAEGEHMGPLEAALSLIPGAFPIGGRLINKYGKDYLLKFARKLETSGIINPSKFERIQERLLVMGDDGFTRATTEDVSQRMLDREIKGSKEEIIAKLIERGEKSSESLGQVLKASAKMYNKSDIPIAENLLNKLELEYSDSMSSIYADKLNLIKEFRKKLSDGTITLKEINKIKQLVREDLNPFTASGKVKAAKKDLSAATSELRKFVEDQAEKTIKGVKSSDIALLNNEISTSYGLAEGISKKASSEFRQELLNFFAGKSSGMLIGGIAGSQVGPFDGNTLVGKIGNILVGTVIGGLTSNTKTKTWLANKINNMFSKSELPILEKYIKLLEKGDIKAIDESMEIVEKKLQTLSDDASKQLALPNPEGVSPSNIGTQTNPIKLGAPKKKDIVELPFNINKQQDGLNNLTTTTNMSDNISSNINNNNKLNVKNNKGLSNLGNFKRLETTGLPKSSKGFGFDDMFGKKGVKEIVNKADFEILEQYTKKGLTKSEIEAIQNYSISSEKDVNNKLISKGLKKLDNYDGIVYRGDDFDLTKGKKVGDTIKIDRLMSTELKKNYYNRYPIKYEITSTNGKQLGKMNNKEFEVLFDKGTEFKIDKIIDNKDGTKIIKLSEIGGKSLVPEKGLSNLGNNIKNTK